MSGTRRKQSHKKRAHSPRKGCAQCGRDAVGSVDTRAHGGPANEPVCAFHKLVWDQYEEGDHIIFGSEDLAELPYIPLKYGG